MTDATERKLAIAMEALRVISHHHVGLTRADRALTEIAAVDAPPAPGLAEIGAREYCKAGEVDYDKLKASQQVQYRQDAMRAYAAMKAADPEADPLRDPRVRELIAAVKLYGAYTDRVLAALAALEHKPETINDQ